MLVSFVQGEDCLFQIGRRISVYVLLAFHGGDYYAVSANQLLFVVFGRCLDTLGQKIFANHLLDIVSMCFLGRNPPAQLVLRQCIFFCGKLGNQFACLLNGSLILELLLETMLVGENSAWNLAMAIGEIALRQVKVTRQR